MNDSLFKAPAVYPFVECPNCKQLLELGATLCPRCREEIHLEYALASAMIIHHNTQAVSVANSILTFNSFIPIALLGSVLVYVLDMYSYGSLRTFSVIFVWPAIPLLAITIWFFRFGRFSLGDEEYLNAKREMRRSFMFWLALLVVQVLAVAIWWL